MTTSRFRRHTKACDEANGVSATEICACHIDPLVSRCRRCDDLHILNPEGLCLDCVAAVDREFEASSPACIVCADWDDTVAMRPVTKTTHARLCAACGASPEVLAVLAEED